MFSRGVVSILVEKAEPLAGRPADHGTRFRYDKSKLQTEWSLKEKGAGPAALGLAPLFLKW
jgi:hypothetical protein